MIDAINSLTGLLNKIEPIKILMSQVNGVQFEYHDKSDVKHIDVISDAVTIAEFEFRAYSSSDSFLSDQRQKHEDGLIGEINTDNVIGWAFSLDGTDHSIYFCGTDANEIVAITLACDSEESLMSLLECFEIIAPINVEVVDIDIEDPDQYDSERFTMGYFGTKFNVISYENGAEHLANAADFSLSVHRNKNDKSPIMVNALYELGSDGLRREINRCMQEYDLGNIIRVSTSNIEGFAFQSNDDSIYFCGWTTDSKVIFEVKNAESMNELIDVLERLSIIRREVAIGDLMYIIEYFQ